MKTTSELAEATAHHRAAKRMATLLGFCDACSHDLVHERGVWVCLNPECEAEKERETCERY